jgi:hypothetical protein
VDEFVLTAPIGTKSRVILTDRCHIFGRAAQLGHRAVVWTLQADPVCANLGPVKSTRKPVGPLCWKVRAESGLIDANLGAGVTQGHFEKVVQDASKIPQWCIGCDSRSDGGFA